MSLVHVLFIVKADEHQQKEKQKRNSGKNINEKVTEWSPESAGDYCSGTNHVLPTAGFATSYSGLSVDSFCKSISVQSLSKEGLQSIGGDIINLAMSEGLEAHAKAVRVRIEE